jgi:two-component system, NarL family, invasion response regulator UvrY
MELEPTEERVVSGSDQEDRADGARAEDPLVSVLVVDDRDSFRTVIRDLVAATEGFVLVGEAESGEDGLAAEAELSPQLVIMDKRMPGIGGIEACRLMVERRPDVVVVLVSVEEPNVEGLQSCGAAAFVQKHELSRKFLRQVWQAHRPRTSEAT